MKKFLLKTLEVLAGACVIAAAVYVYMNYSPKRDSSAVKTQSASLVETSVLEETEFDTLIEAQGNTVANDIIDLTASAQEKIIKINFKDGQEVKAGMVVMELENDLETAELRQAEVNLDEQKREYERIKPLYASRVASSKDYENQLTAYERAKLLVTAAKTKLDDRIIRVPFDGVIGRRAVGFGALVSPGTKVATLYDISVIKVDFRVPEKYLASVCDGLEFTAVSEAYPGRKFGGKVYFIDVDVDVNTRTVGVRGKIQNTPDSNGVRPLRPGMLLDVELRLGRASTVMIPEKAVMSLGEMQYIFICSPSDTVSRREVVLGARRNGMVELLSGAKAGERYVLEGVSKLVNSPDGVKIRTSESASASAKGEEK